LARLREREGGSWAEYQHLQNPEGGERYIDRTRKRPRRLSCMNEEDAGVEVRG
jgi:hypothetical protein